MTELPHIRLQNLYKKYTYLEHDAYYDVIRFYEQNEQDIAWLPIQQSLNIEKHYLKALFLVERYEKYAYKSQLFLQRLIFNNITVIDGEKIYEDIIYNRAVSLYYCKQFEDAQCVVEELLKMDVNHVEAKYLYFVLQKQQDIHLFKWLKAILIVTIILSIIFLIAQQFIVSQHYPEFNHAYLDGVATLIFPILIVLTISNVFLLLKARFKLISFISMCKRRK